MPRIAAALLVVATVMCSIAWNTSRYPVVWEMAAVGGRSCPSAESSQSEGTGQSAPLSQPELSSQSQPPVQPYGGSYGGGDSYGVSQSTDAQSLCCESTGVCSIGDLHRKAGTCDSPASRSVESSQEAAVRPLAAQPPREPPGNDASPASDEPDYSGAGFAADDRAGDCTASGVASEDTHESGERPRLVPVPPPGCCRPSHTRKQVRRLPPVDRPGVIGPQHNSAQSPQAPIPIYPKAAIE